MASRLTLHECFEELEIKPGCTVAELKESYRDLARVWHPDRFSGKDRLIDKANKKLQRVNLAYEILLERVDADGIVTPPPPPAAKAPRPPAAAAAGAAGAGAPPPPPPPGATRTGPAAGYARPSGGRRSTGTGDWQMVRPVQRRLRDVLPTRWLLLLALLAAAPLVARHFRGTAAPTASAPLEVVVHRPRQGEFLREAQIKVSGNVSPISDSAEVRVQGRPVTVQNGAFVHSLEMPEGANQEISVLVSAGGAEPVATRITVHVDRTRPELAILQPAADTLTAEDEITVSGTTSDDTVEVRAAGVAATPADGAWSLAVPLLRGENKIDVLARDRAGNERHQMLLVRHDSDGPGLKIRKPGAGDIVWTTSVPVSGSTGEDVREVNVAGQIVRVVERRFSCTVELPEGEHDLEVVAADAAGNLDRKVVHFRVDTTAPKFLRLEPDEDTPVRAGRVVISGRLDDPTCRVRVAGNGASNDEGEFRATLSLPAGTHEVVIEAEDKGDRLSVETVLLTVVEHSEERSAGGKPGAPLTKASVALAEGERAYKTGNYAVATQQFELAARLDGTLDLDRRLGLAYYKMGRKNHDDYTQMYIRARDTKNVELARKLNKLGTQVEREFAEARGYLEKAKAAATERDFVLDFCLADTARTSETPAGKQRRVDGLRAAVKDFTPTTEEERKYYQEALVVLARADREK